MSTEHKPHQPFMGSKLGGGGKGFRTLGASKWKSVGVSFDMFHQVTFTLAQQTADGAGIRLNSI